MHKPTENKLETTNAAEVVVVATPAAEALFADWIDGELEKLVAKWIHLAAPNAKRSRALRRSR